MFTRLLAAAPTPVESVQKQTNIFMRYITSIDWDKLLSTSLLDCFKLSYSPLYSTSSIA